MLIETKEKAVELINKVVPYSQQIKDWDFTTEENAIRFEWRSDVFRVDLTYCSVEEVGDGILSGSNIAILLTHLLKTNL